MSSKLIVSALAVLTVQAKVDQVPLGFTGPILSGLLIGLFIIVIFICGFIPLFSINTPEDFARHPLAIGKES